MDGVGTGQPALVEAEGWGLSREEGRILTVPRYERKGVINQDGCHNEAILFLKKRRTI